jgi:hypothetical protein
MNESTCSSTSNKNSFLQSLNEADSNHTGGLDSVSASILINDESMVSVEGQHQLRQQHLSNSSCTTPDKSLEKTLNMIANSSNTNSNASVCSNGRNDKHGMFDRFLKNYSFSAENGDKSGMLANNGMSGQPPANMMSVMDEPEISFVSGCKSAASSIQNSPQKTNPSSKTSSSLYTTTTASNTTTNSNTTCTTGSFTSNASNNSSLSLIQLQQRQLSMQFANVSPIVNETIQKKGNLSNTTIANLRDIQSFSNISVPYDITVSNRKSDTSGSQLVEGRLGTTAEEEDKQESQHEKTLSSSSSSSLIEGRLSARLSFDQSQTNLNDSNSIQQQNSQNQVKCVTNKGLRRKSTSSNNNNNNNQLTTVSPLSSSCNSSRKNNSNDSLLSFEKHEISQAIGCESVYSNKK